MTKKKAKANKLQIPNVNAQSSLQSAPQSTLGSPFQTPPTSPSSAVGSLPSTNLLDQTHGELQKPAQAQEPIDTLDVSVTDIASKDIVAIADLFSTMKTALVTMSNAFDRLGGQTEKMVSLSLDIKLQDQVCFQLLLSLSSYSRIYRFSNFNPDWKNKLLSRKRKSRICDSR